MSIRIR